ncbi:MAG: hypothetical protein H6550_14630 [Chitinophagales bacterium]|nr:hypothetical protein [Chitinophagales bacterium]
MKMYEVKTNEDKQAFLALPVEIYRNDPNWIRPLDKDIEEVFDPGKNKFFRKGECSRWLLKDNGGKTIGRIAAFVNNTYKQEQPTGGIGFFECINDYTSAAFMLDHCKNWLQERSMEAMDGPINFGERDAWWGLQTEGFQQPLYRMNYNPPYYRELFEQYGFQTYFEQLCFSLDPQQPLQEKFMHSHEKVSADPNFKAIHYNKKQLHKFAGDFTTIYNKAWAAHIGNKQMEERSVVKMLQGINAVVDEQIIWFTYYKEEPIAFWVNIPDLNQYFKHFNGKLGILQKLRLLWMKAFTRIDRFTGLVFGVVPEYQGKGVDGFMIVEAAKIIQGKHLYDKYEMQWIGDWNPKMISIAESLGTHISRKLRTYRYLFDRTKEFKRHPILK